MENKNIADLSVSVYREFPYFIGAWTGAGDLAKFRMQLYSCTKVNAPSSSRWGGAEGWKWSKQK